MFLIYNAMPSFKGLNTAYVVCSENNMAKRLEKPYVGAYSLT